MSLVAQDRLARGLTLGMALLVAACLLLVGWTFYRPSGDAAPAAAAPEKITAVDGFR